MVSEHSPEFLALQKAVQDIANLRNDGPVIITSAMVVWEEMDYHRSDGKPGFEIDYAMVSESVSLAASLGLMEAGATLMRQVVSKDVFEEEDEDD